jgi:hypothetical protein
MKTGSQCVSNMNGTMLQVNVFEAMGMKTGEFNENGLMQ